MNTKHTKRQRIDKMMRDYIERLERDGRYQTTHLELGRRRLDRGDTNTKGMRTRSQARASIKSKGIA
jgi:hypothetical protein